MPEFVFRSERYWIATLQTDLAIHTTSAVILAGSLVALLKRSCGRASCEELVQGVSRWINQGALCEE